MYPVEYKLKAEVQPVYLLPVILLNVQVETGCFLPHFQGNRMTHHLKALPRCPHALKLLSIPENLGMFPS